MFTLAYHLRETWPRGVPCLAELAEELSWFEANLATPTRFSASRYPRAQETALSWIKSQADEHVRRLRLMVALIESAADVRIDEVRTDRPGYIVFEDQHQVVAFPFTDTPR